MCMIKHSVSDVVCLSCELFSRSVQFTLKPPTLNVKLDQVPFVWLVRAPPASGSQGEKERERG